MNPTLFRILAEADPCKMSPTGCSDDHKAIIGDLSSKIIDVILMVVGVVAVFVVIYGGFLMMTSAGDPGKVKKGKSAILGGVIGLVIAILAKAIIAFVLDGLEL